MALVPVLVSNLGRMATRKCFTCKQQLPFVDYHGSQWQKRANRRCKTCGGSQFCEHKRLRRQCTSAARSSRHRRSPCVLTTSAWPAVVSAAAPSAVMSCPFPSVSGMCVCRTIRELFTQGCKTAIMPGSSATSTAMAVELRAAGAVASWKKNSWQILCAGTTSSFRCCQTVNFLLDIRARVCRERAARRRAWCARAGACCVGNQGVRCD
jgi:hypothetical protein